MANHQIYGTADPRDKLTDVLIACYTNSTLSAPNYQTMGYSNSFMLQRVSSEHCGGVQTIVTGGVVKGWTNWWHNEVHSAAHDALRGGVQGEGMYPPVVTANGLFDS